jgi:hypothetical protein
MSSQTRLLNRGQNILPWTIGESMPDESGAVVHLIGLEIPEQTYLIYRAILIGPVAGTLIGGAVGVCLAMLYRQEPEARAHVYIDDSLPLLLGGAVLGCLAGVCMLALCKWWPWAISPLTVLVMTLLGAAILAPIGWIAGDRWEERPASRWHDLGCINRCGGWACVGRSPVIRRLAHASRQTKENNVDAVAVPGAPENK